jgi:hypothetical protein
MIRDFVYRSWGCRITFQLISCSVYNDLLASAVGLLALLPLLMVDAESFLANALEPLGMHGNGSIGHPLYYRIDFLCPPMLNDCVLGLLGNPDLLAPVHQPVSRHADNEASGGSQHCEQGVNARVGVSLFEAVIVYFL